MVHILHDKLWFPDAEEADEDGLLAIGGDLGAERLLLAYRSGIFPWYNEDEPPMWWNPDPRCVLFPADINVSKSMKQVLKKGEFEFRFNTSFEEVMRNCQQMERKDQDGTWITDNIIAAYTELHKRGYAVSAETWKGNVLIGGLYGIRMGNIFFGESMFSRESNASKFAFIKLADQLREEGVVLIDCQIYTEHLASMGAVMISRELFLTVLAINI